MKISKSIIRFPFSLLLIGNALFVLNACRSIKAETPVEVVTSIPEVDQPVSSLVLPLIINLKPYYAQADKSVPSSFSGFDNPCSGVSYSYKFDRDPISLETNGTKIKIDVSGKYWIKMNYCAGCSELFTNNPVCMTPKIPFSCGVGEPMRRMSIQFTSSYHITKNYGLTTQTTLTDLKPIDPCEVTLFRFDATDKLVKEIRKPLTDLAKEIDKQTAKISFKQDAEALWKTATDPIYLPTIGYLHFNPTGVTMVNPIAKNDKLYTTIIIEAKPELNHIKTSETKSQLPDLNLVEKASTDSFNLILDSKLNYDSLSSTLNRYLVGTIIPLKGKAIKIDSLHVQGADKNELIIEMRFSGSKRGTIYLKGTPVFNVAEQSIYLDHVQFDLKTKHILLKSAKWLFSDKVTSAIENASRQDLKPQLKSVKGHMNKSLHFVKNGFDISGNVSELRVLHLYPSTEALVIRIQAKGKLQITN